jgi:LPS-assembly lipoprotein
MNEAEIPVRPFALFLTLVLLLQACGWQLRTAPEMSALSTLAISGAGNDLRHELTEALDSATVRVDETSDWTLAFSHERWTKRTVATDTRGRAAERELRLELEWRLEPASGDAGAGPRRELTLTRTFQYSPTDATTSSDEEELLRVSMYRDAAWQILRQIEATASQLPLNGEQTDAAAQ